MSAKPDYEVQGDANAADPPFAKPMLWGLRIGAAAIGSAACVFSAFLLLAMLDTVAAEGWRRAAFVIGTGGLGAGAAGLGLLRAAWRGESAAFDALQDRWQRDWVSLQAVRPPSTPALDTYDVASAQRAAADDRLEEWVHEYLLGPGQNVAFSEGLRLRRRYWRGPLEAFVASLERTCGPDPSLPSPVPLESWAARIADLKAGYESLLAFPPLIVQYENGRLLIRDGNHRHGAYEALGLERCWIILWYADEAAFEQHRASAFQL